MHIKTAVTTLPLHPHLIHRWSPRAFSPQKVSVEQLTSIFEAARWSPSSSNEQPWRFVVGCKGDETYERIFSTLVEFNQLWAGTAPVLFLAIAKKTSNKNPEVENRSARYDLGQSLAYLTFQAMEEGLFVHQMAGFDTQKAAELFHVPSDHEVVTVSAVGYEGDPEVLHPNLKESELAPRERKPLSELVFSTRFGETASFIK